MAKSRRQIILDRATVDPLFRDRLIRLGALRDRYTYPNMKTWMMLAPEMMKFAHEAGLLEQDVRQDSVNDLVNWLLENLDELAYYAGRSERMPPGRRYPQTIGNVFLSWTVKSPRDRTAVLGIKKALDYFHVEYFDYTEHEVEGSRDLTEEIERQLRDAIGDSRISIEVNSSELGSFWIQHERDLLKKSEIGLRLSVCLEREQARFVTTNPSEEKRIVRVDMSDGRCLIVASEHLEAWMEAAAETKYYRSDDYLLKCYGLIREVRRRLESGGGADALRTRPDVRALRYDRDAKEFLRRTKNPITSRECEAVFVKAVAARRELYQELRGVLATEREMTKIMLAGNPTAEGSDVKRRDLAYYELELNRKRQIDAVVRQIVPTEDCTYAGLCRHLNGATQNVLHAVRWKTNPPSLLTPGILLRPLVMVLGAAAVWSWLTASLMPLVEAERRYTTPHAVTITIVGGLLVTAYIAWAQGGFADEVRTAGTLLIFVLGPIVCEVVLAPAAAKVLLAFTTMAAIVGTGMVVQPLVVAGLMWHPNLATYLGTAGYFSCSAIVAVGLVRCFGFSPAAAYVAWSAVGGSCLAWTWQRWLAGWHLSPLDRGRPAAVES